MAELTPEERERIYEEEKARADARKRIEVENYTPPKRYRNPLRYCCLIWALVGFVLPAVFVVLTAIFRKH